MFCSYYIHTHTYTHTYIYIYVCVCVRVYVCVHFVVTFVVYIDDVYHFR